MKSENDILCDKIIKKLCPDKVFAVFYKKGWNGKKQLLEIHRLEKTINYSNILKKFIEDKIITRDGVTINLKASAKVVYLDIIRKLFNNHNTRTNRYSDVKENITLTDLNIFLSQITNFNNTYVVFENFKLY